MKLKGGRNIMLILLRVLLQIAMTCMALIVYGGITYVVWAN
jgi:hypothetical protein